MAILAPEIQDQILTLHFSDKRSIKSIAREFGVDPKTVRRLVRRREVKFSPDLRKMKDQERERLRGINTLLHAPPR